MTELHPVPRQLTDERRTQLCDWVRRHGADPQLIPECAVFEYDRASNVWRVQTWVIDGEGGLVRDGLHEDAPLRTETITFAGREPWPTSRTES